MADAGDSHLDLDIVTHTTRKERDGTKRKYSNNIRVRADGKAQVEIGGAGRRRETIDSSARACQVMLYEMDQAMMRANYRESPFTPIPKPSKTKQKPARQPKDDDLVPCPKCGGQLDTCAFCGGELYLTYRRARELASPEEE